MNPKTKKVLLKAVQAIFYVNIFLYLLACLTPYISSAYFFGFAFLALAFPVLLVSMLFWLLVSLFIKRKKSWLLAIIILVGYKNISSSIGFHLFSSNAVSKSNHSFRVLSWNVEAFLTQQKRYDTVGSPIKKMIAFIEKSNADIVCLQDFEQTTGDLFIQYIDLIKDSLHYPNVYFSVDIDSVLSYGRCRYGTCIFSKFPITNSGSIQYSGKYFSESLGYADVKIKDKTMRVFNTHLRSMYLNILHSKQYAFKYIIEDTNLVFHSNKLEKNTTL